MKDTKREYLPLYSFYDRSGVARHLEEMAARGWLIEKLGGWCWSYRRIEPQKLRFAVTYFPKATLYDPAPTEGLETFRAFCAEAGWILAADNAQVQVFYNEAESPVPIETDAGADYENIHRSMQKSTLRSYWVLLAFCVLEIVLCLQSVLRDPIGTLSSALQLNTLFSFFPLLLLIAVELIRYHRWKRRAEAALELGEPLPELRSARWLGITILVLSVIQLTALLFLSSNSSPGMLLVVVFMLLFMVVLIVLSNVVRKTMQRLRVKPWVNRVVTIGVIMLLTIGMMTGLTAMILSGSRLFSGGDAPETYEFQGHTWNVYHDPIPLAMEDLMSLDYTQWSTRLMESTSPLLTRIEASQRPRLDALQQPDLGYEIVIVKAPFLYGLCKQNFIRWLERDNEQLPKEYREEYRPIDPVPWGAAEAYQRYSAGEPVNQFLICWPDRITEISFDWEWVITEEMMSIAAEKLLEA